MSRKSCPHFFHPLAAVETHSDGQCFANAFAVAEDQVNLALTGALVPGLRMVQILRSTGFDRLHIQSMFDDARHGNHHARLRMIEFMADAIVVEKDLDAREFENDTDDPISMGTS